MVGSVLGMTAVGVLQLAGLCLADNSAATASTSSPVPTDITGPYIGPNVTAGRPIVGDYGGQYRPQIHFSPPQHFMNDPNGMFRDDNGTWHLYYQYNPTAIVAGNQHWGHATSRDLYHWVNQPIALFPPKENFFIFSGSVVIDRNNTSGFFPNQTNGVVAIYTLAEQGADGSPRPQTQSIAYSYDNGYSFVTYEGNPVIPSNSSQFRDPKVVWYDDHWVMAVAYPYDFEIGIFTSPNLIDWTPASNFSHHGLLGLQWECPNLVKMPHVDENGDKQDDMWLMAISINPGAPLGGSITQYHPGTFNGTHFEAVDSAARIADFGKDNYAGQFFYGTPRTRTPSSWPGPPIGKGWRSAMTLPRRTYLTKVGRVGWKLVSTPYDLSPVWGDVLASNDSLTNSTLTVDFSDVSSNAIYWEANVTGIPESGISGLATMNFTFTSPLTGEYLRGGINFGGDTPVFLDRGGARGFSDIYFMDKFSTNSLLSGASWNMNGVIDRSMLELFLNDGVDSATTIFFTSQPLTLMIFSTSNLPNGMQVSFRVNSLRSAWAAMESEDDGLVHGNQSTKDTGAQNMRRMLGSGM
ncbi:beta-fructofuranosidase [Dactylonectria macrodidyma]|uniref:Beta-fructofuranosidase n=1 Tax=Dactylonectria macrodidyma TaxID=307937 RepID=A0A9P9I8Z1_9HYPO|nr:beta-fructofuranosidase [Dactylonectria macrodidyma]